MSDIGQKLIEAVREVVDHNPDFIYPKNSSLPASRQCAYVRDGAPSCLIGHAAWNIGIISGKIESNPDLNSTGVYEFIQRFNLKVDQLEEEWLSMVQDEQDTGSTWRDAVENADAWQEVKSA